MGGCLMDDLIPINRKIRQYVPPGGPDVRGNNRSNPGIREASVKTVDGLGLGSLFLGDWIPTSFHVIRRRR